MGIDTWNGHIPSDPPVMDPASGHLVIDVKSWLTDQVYLEGIGDSFVNKGNVTNPNARKIGVHGEKLHGPLQVMLRLLVVAVGYLVATLTAAILMITDPQDQNV